MAEKVYTLDEYFTVKEGEENNIDKMPVPSPPNLENFQKVKALCICCSQIVVKLYPPTRRITAKHYETICDRCKLKDGDNLRTWG